MARSAKRRSNASKPKKEAIPSQDESLREHVLNLLGWRDAHTEFEEALAGLPPKLRGTRPPGAPHSPWELLEHMRLAQEDILEFMRNPKYVAPKFPEGYWPAAEAPPNDAAWEKSLESFRNDAKAMRALVKDPRTDLFARIPHGQGQTVLREALLLADHNSYHIGQLVLARRLLGAWKG
jgi:DinB superfamily